MASVHTLESCKASALKYQTRNEWKASDNPSYQAAIRNKWVVECTPHMIVSKGGAKAGERNHTTAEYLALYHAVHGDRYDTSLVDYKDSVTKIKLICSEHGIFEQRPASSLNGIGCPRCGLAKQVAARTGRRTDKPASNKLNTAQALQRLHASHEGLYEYPDFDFEGKTNKDKIDIVCATHGLFTQRFDKHTHGNGCPSCAHTGPSKGEQEVFDYVKSLCADAEQTNKTLIAPKHIDIYIPSLKIGIEYNGLWHHSEACKDSAEARHYHQGKTTQAGAAGVRLIHIWEDEWLDKSELIKAYLRRVLNQPSRRINGRDCTAVPITSLQARDFLNTHHLQGACAGGGYGLYCNDELVAVATVRAIKNITSYRELARWCVKSDVSIIGGLSKVLARINEPLISYCDTAKHTGEGYGKAGWEQLQTTEPSFYYANNKSRVNRQSFMKHKLLAKGATGNTERELAASLGFYRIWGCNQLKFAWEPK